jgi:hypothetical protein
MATPFLIHDPAREAVAAMRGFSYQMLRSVQVWIELGEDEVLVLEGAEDLDIVKHGYATVEQVKDTSGSGRLSLGIAGRLVHSGRTDDHSDHAVIAGHA